MLPATRRVLLLTNRIPYPLSDGGALAMDAMRKAYEQLEWEVHLLAMRTPRQTVSDADVEAALAPLASYKSVPVDTRVKPAPTLLNFLGSRASSHEVRHRSERFASVLSDTLYQIAPDVVQFESVYLAPYLSVIRKAAPHAVAVLRVHNVEHQVWTRYAAASRGPKRLYLHSLARRIRRFEAAWWPRFDALFTLTEEDAAVIAGTSGPASVHVVPFSTQPMAMLDAQPRWEGYHLAAMDWLPNVEAMDWMVNEVWPAIHAASPEFRFHFAGRHMPARFLRHQGPQLFCHGEVTNPLDLTLTNKMLLVPLRSGGGVRIKILEAMAAGRVVISTTIGIQGIAAQDGAHYLRADTPNEFAQAVRWCLDHREEAAAIGRTAKDLISAQYSAEAVGNKLRAALDPLLTR